MTEEDELVRLARSGDQEGFRKLVEMYAPLTERVARVLLPDRSDAEDAVQEAWLDVWRGLPRFELGRPLRPWLLTIVGNRCRMARRRLKLPSVPYDDALAGGLLLPATWQAARREDGGYCDAVRILLDGLDESHRQLLALRFFADLQLDEIAELLDVPVGTVKSRLHRTLQHLRRLIEEGAVEKGM